VSRLRSRSLRSLRARAERGIALLTVLFAVALLMTIVAVLVNVCTARLQRSTQDLRALQAVAAADAGAGWVRAILARNYGDVSSTLAELAAAHSTVHVDIDAQTSADVTVSLQMPAATTSADHLDRQLQENARILEAPAQVVATASLSVAGTPQATRSVTTLLRIFHGAAPYSEVVGIIDDAGPVAANSPGDPAGQAGTTFATDLRLRAFKGTAGEPVPADNFQDKEWSDGKTASGGFLP
jgi:hypothetical protein